MPSWRDRPRNYQQPCEECKEPGVMCQQLNPLNWQPITRRLCRKHRERLGFHAVDYSRGGHINGNYPRP